MVPLAQGDFWSILSQLLSLADKDVSQLLAFALVLLGIYVVIDKLAKLPGAFKTWRNRRRGHVEIDPNTKLLSDLAESIALLTRNQNQNAENTKRLIDRADLLEGLVTQNTAANSELATVTHQVATLLTGALAEMRGAQAGIIEQVAARLDTTKAELASTLGGVGQTVSQNATTLTSLDQKVTAHSAMTEREFAELTRLLKALPDSVAAAIQEALTRLAALEMEVELLRPEKARADDLAHQLQKALGENKSLTEQLADERRLHALHEHEAPAAPKAEDAPA